ncbi:MAG: ABC transporter substrate-binding protein, partial [Chloroflexota bacterium]
MTGHIHASRRSVRTLAGLATVAVLLGACSSSSGSTPPSSAPQSAAASTAPAGSGAAQSGAPSSLGATSIRSNEHEKVPSASVKAMVDYCTNKTGVTAPVAITNHNDFQDQFNTFMQGTPEDIVKWFTGERLRFPARNGLLTPIDDVWQTIAANYTDGLAKASQGDDGKKYAVPIVSYPWVVLYRKSFFQEKGYTVPKTWDEFVTLAKKIQADKVIPLAFADKDGWPAMGTFDILNMRINGYDFHVSLMAGKE